MGWGKPLECTDEAHLNAESFLDGHSMARLVQVESHLCPLVLCAPGVVRGLMKAAHGPRAS